ncbi:bifunctional serine/threonine-protein kinase/formylglycine-generating enzyme family protein [Luteimonas sp. 100069]|uniref:bifunctional serine/threonine-protein kinase/formylglycine-generating enzyme family protein n=1 Tax=Luteimonas sp. 100069 TaxID=2006109 RepID=UPI001315A00C|nr:bifunctional serine/threonine-protein kinase/formylglycine-generating enzyme family protein [Luteimonas sp. 100069]
MSQYVHGLEEPMTLPEITGYRVVRVVGHGGMATVYLGTQLSLGRDVAIKVMRPEALADEVSRRRFENEARTIARLEHPNIVGIHEVGRTADGLPWYAMPYLPHGHLGRRDLTRDHARVREVLRALLSALAYAHARGVIHRDVKAENVLFDEADRPLLADFGIALRRGYGTRVTMVGLAVGSTAYMAPEQARGQQVDFRADLYSVGVLAWEMLNGSLPYQADDALSMALAHTQNPIPRLPPALRHWQRFIDRALAKSPGRRFADANQMLQALAEVPLRGGRSAPLIEGALRRAGAGARRVPPLLWIPAVLVLAAGIGLLLRPATQPDPDTQAAAQASTLPSPEAGDAQGLARDDMSGTAATAGPMELVDPAAARVAPVSQADRYLLEAERRMQAGHLAAPEGANAFESLTRAWRADREHLRFAPVSARALDAAAARAGALIAKGAHAEAAAMLTAARQHAAATGQAEGEAMRQLRAKVETAADARIAAAATAVDRADALAALAAAEAAGIDAAVTTRLRRLAMTIPDVAALAARVAGGARVVRGPDGAYAIANAPVSRADYAAFVAATGHKSASCRARGSVLRALAPKNWEDPGFEQSPSDPVVCVSWDDAMEYARWRSEREGRSIVVASTAQGASVATRAMGPAEWRSDCAAACKDRIAAGRSQRDELSSRALDPRRGYDDVGFRLAHLP